MLAHHARAAPTRARREVDAGCDWVLVGIPGVVALVPPEYLRRQADAPELMRRLAAIADDFNR